MRCEMSKGYVFDMDGVIWDGDRPMPQAAKRINEIIASGKEHVFMTNNALRSREAYVKRLREYGIKTDLSRVIISSYAAGLCIREKGGPSRVYAMGTDELKKELKSVGHSIVEEGADYVVVGLDKELAYAKMDRAFRNLKAGAELVACAPDLTYLEDGGIHIGSGAFARALETAAGKELTVIGKPGKTMMELAAERMGLEPGEITAVGDKLSTDALAAKRAGMKSALVLTGETSRKDAEGSEIKPDLILDNLKGLP